MSPSSRMNSSTLQATKKRIVVSQQSGESKVMVPARTVTGPDGKAIV